MNATPTARSIMLRNLPHASTSASAVSTATSTLAPRVLLASKRVASAATTRTGGLFPAGVSVGSVASFSSSAARAAEKDAAAQQQPVPKTGLLRSLLHGSESAKADGLTTTAISHSTQVARGKYIHEIVRHSVRTDKAAEYRNVIAHYYPMISGQSNNFHSKLIGSWQVCVGDLETFYHIWQYDGYAGYDACRETLWESDVLRELEAKLAPCIKARSNWLGQEFAFWPTSAKVHKDKYSMREGSTMYNESKPDKDWIFELRTYHLKPGMLLEWEQHWRRGLEARRRFVEPIGAWFAQVGHLHTVMHLWAYPSLEERKRTRDAAWQVETWNDTVSQTVKLVDKMHAQMMYPMKFSPLK
ncbi:NIPSNAP-domain-containing protein [Tilletiaria anomala UBC 951]|uniref:NIPSNAP-domain-containing protein n=1 Tax=Tilletiaria anomala (strain ATCC 24038 / CBS 436.72 / UBC 951) TaxID=1037660 RepID=A0A066WR29_TILAU|nr:NIPSNAP-domain-containing protein [Tilletiaria anomala UBC 951]KDN53100.1 NIPSNAP-domain-containing protein [Tilletiaria anomala UBC 951]